MQRLLPILKNISDTYRNSKSRSIRKYGRHERLLCNDKNILSAQARKATSRHGILVKSISQPQYESMMSSGFALTLLLKLSLKTRRL